MKIRFAPGFNPTGNYSLNGQHAPACVSQPECSGIITTTPSPPTTASALADDHACNVNTTCPDGTLCTVTGR